jgi:hypothetical protein
MIGLDGIRWVAGVGVGGAGAEVAVGGVAGSIHINSTVIFLFLFLFYFHRFLFHPIILSSYRPIVANFIFPYLQIAYLHISKNAAHINSMYSVRKMFYRTEWDIK